MKREMKTTILGTAALALTPFVAFAQTNLENKAGSDQPPVVEVAEDTSTASYADKDVFVHYDDEFYYVTDGKAYLIDDELATKLKIETEPNGTIIFDDGETVLLKEHQMSDVEGTLFGIPDTIKGIVLDLAEEVDGQPEG